MHLPLEYSSDVYKIRFLSEKDIPEAFELCRENVDYYELRKTIPSEENLRFVWKDIPQDADQKAQFWRSNDFYPTMRETRMDAASNHITELERQLIFRRQQ